MRIVVVQNLFQMIKINTKKLNILLCVEQNFAENLQNKTVLDFDCLTLTFDISGFDHNPMVRLDLYLNWE